MVNVYGEEDQWRRGRRMEGRCCCGKKVADLDIYFFLLLNKTEWVLVYSPETCCLHL